MADYEVIQNGVISKTNEPVYQVAMKNEDGTHTVVVPKIMTKEEAEAELVNIVGKPAIIAETVEVSAPSYDYEPPKKKTILKKSKKAK